MQDKVKILLVDDEERFVDGLQTILNHYDFACTKALSGSAAIDLLKEKEFDVALLDVGLPDISGCDIAEFITNSCKNTIAIMLTGLNTVETAVQAMKQGAYDFLAKPVNHDLLIKSIGKALEHNKLRKDLRTSENRFQVLAEAAWEGIAILDKDNLLEANSQFLRMFGYRRAELAGARFLEKIFTPSSLKKAIQQLNDDPSAGFELTGIRKDSTRFPVEAKWRNMDYFGKPAKVCVIRDITERLHNEQEKLALLEKLAKANKLKALGLMAGSVAHDLNNILTAVVSYPDILLMQMEETDRYYDEIKRIQEAGKRAAAVVDDLVSIARGRKTEATVENVNDIILAHLNSIEHSERLLEFPEIVVQTHLQPNLYSSHCSSQQVHKILLNLIGNAFEAIDGQGIISITTANSRFANPIGKDQSRRVGNYVKLSVADSGQGIAKADLQHIFDPFYSTKRGQKSGTGLGLSIVWNTVLENDGWVEVADNHPGTVFDIYLPVSGDVSLPAVEPVTTNGAAGGGKTILLVDDQPEQNEAMQKMLSGLGYKTFAVTSSEEAIAFLRSCRVDLVILDMVMDEDLNGCQIYQKMLALHPDQKAIIVSGYSESELVIQAKQLGVTHFLQKPVTLSTLTKAITQSLGPG